MGEITPVKNKTISLFRKNPKKAFYGEINLDIRRFTKIKMVLKNRKN
jgi:hypothetical protein